MQFSTNTHVFNDAFNCYVHWVTFHVGNCNWFISCLWMQIHTYDIGLHSQWWAVLWKLSHWIPIILQIIPRQVTLSSHCQSFLRWIFDDVKHFYTRRKYNLVNPIFSCICQIPCLDKRSPFPKYNFLSREEAVIINFYSWDFCTEHMIFTGVCCVKVLHFYWTDIL